MDGSFKLGEKKRRFNPGPSYDFEINLFPPTHDSYPEFDFQELTELQKNVRKAEDEEEKGRARKNLQRALRGESRPAVTKFYQLSKGDGYDKNDPFIDDSEEFDETVPPSVDTIKGGFYVNRGLAELKEVEEPPERIAQPRPKDYPDDDKIKRMRNILKQKFDDKKKRLKDQAKLMKKKQKEEKLLAKYGRVAEDKSKMADASFNVKSSLQQKRAKKLVTIPTETSNQDNSISETLKESSSINEPSKLLANPVQADKDDDHLPLSTFASGTATLPSTSQQSGIVKRRPVEPDDETNKMINAFKKATHNLAAPGQKKRLQRDHVLMLIGIEDRMVEQKMNTHERSRVIQGIADFIGIQKQSLYIRMKAIRDEGKKDIEILSASESIMQNEAATPTTSSATSNVVKTVNENKVVEAQTSKAATKPVTSTPTTKVPGSSNTNQNGVTAKQNGSVSQQTNGKQIIQLSEGAKVASTNQVIPNLSGITQEVLQKKFEAVYTAFAMAYKEALEKAEIDFMSQKLKLSIGGSTAVPKKIIKFDAKLNSALIDLSLFSIGVAKFYESKNVSLKQVLVGMFERCLKETPGPITTDEFLLHVAKECPKAKELLKSELLQISTKPKPLTNRIDQAENREQDKKMLGKMKVANFTKQPSATML
ncbi:unnamed protein product, partial [Mesorhabditis belari]|uniref:Hpc2-related domain-containing protein n=1 Tax=Mesorhabditis belari TaxID=2138241 RepID=A0AAF3E7Z8_9BILA